MTDNHDLNIPERGAKDWHTMLNENFSKLDASVEIRDTENNRDQYVPKEGSKFFATDTGSIYTGDGSDWSAVDLFQTTIESFQDALIEGYIVGIIPNHKVVVDPTEHESGAVALQTANDMLLEKANRGVYGFVYIPSKDSNGDELVIDRTVVFGSRTERFGAFPRGWGFTGRSENMLRCTIDNGDPMFVVAQNTENEGRLSGNASSFGGFVAYADGNDAGFLRLENVVAFHLRDASAIEFDCPTADGVFVLDGACYNGYIDCCEYVASRVHCPDADVWVIRNDNGDGPPGEIKWGPGCSTYADPDRPFNIGYRQEVNASSMALGGRIEGDGGPAKLYVTEGRLYITGYWESGRSEGTNKDDLFFDGYRLQISPAAEWESNRTGGHIIHIGENASRVYLPTIQNDGVEGGDVIHFDSGGGGSNIYVVPYPETFNGSVTYPEPSWSATTYHDGWQKLYEGTTDIKPNTITELTKWAGDAGEKVSLQRMSIVSPPDGDTRFQPVYGWNTEEEKHWVGIEEKAGYEFSLYWEVHRRPNSQIK